MNDIKQFDRIALVKVPVARWYEVREDLGRNLLAYSSEHGCTLIPLPPGNWRYICLSTEMTEELAREVVGFPNDYHYKDYTGFYLYLNTAMASFTSLLTALGCDPAGTYAVCVKND